MSKLEYTGEFVVPGRVPYENWQEHVNRYLFAKSFVKGKVVPDIACGTGYGSRILAEEANTVVGGDISRDAVAYAKKAFVAGNLDFILLDAHYLPFRKGAFDVVVSFETIEHLEKPEHFLDEVRRTLKGCLIISTPNGEYNSRRGFVNPFHIKEFSLEECLRMLKRRFENLQFFMQHPLTFKERLIKYYGYKLFRLLWNFATLVLKGLDLIKKFYLKIPSGGASDVYRIDVRFGVVPYRHGEIFTTIIAVVGINPWKNAIPWFR